MIRHQVYFDTLGSLREDSASWRSVFAGLSVLRLVDSYADNSASVDPANWAQLHSVRSSIQDVSAGDPIRGVLATVLEETIARGTIDEIVCRSLLAYGRALDYEASWGLATDVFQTVAKLTRPEKNAKLSVEANVLTGGSARRNGDWEVSARAYSQAAYVADTIGDREGVLTVQVGIANTYFAKGNLPQAQSILDDVIVQAEGTALAEIRGKALHSAAAIAHRRGNPSEGLKLAYDGLALIKDPAARDFVLGDIAAMFTELGLRDAARDAHLILAATAQTKLLQWSAMINLMELSSLDRDEESFDSYARQLAKTPMGVWLRSHYLLTLGEGFQRFGRYQAAVDAFQEATAFADANHIHQVAFNAQKALETARSVPAAPATFDPSSMWLPDQVSTVARAISDLRKSALAAS